MSRAPRPIVISGPSGVGKGTLVSKAIRLRPDFVRSVSATTRSPRPTEVDGVDYHFVDDATFDALVERDAFLEWANVFGQRYGTLESEVDEALVAGHPVLLEIDVQGGLAIQRRRDDALLVFVEPPSLEELERRLRARGTEDEDSIARRLACAHDELLVAPRYDVRIVNDDADRCAAELADIIEAQVKG